MQKIEEADITLEEAKILLKYRRYEHICQKYRIAERNLKKRLKIMPKMLLLKQYKFLKLWVKKLFRQYRFQMKK